ncbi:homoserine kinase [Virgibacillus salarius]|uniref:homoserine kinase n=1 Tax=Virgibacillus salarius TaxID=447199 RepID=UPI0024927D38|nr:homoserine kinase [Virgibacillus salarius]WBX80876.1 homoserine kinase [Virgibacillus salarius]
MNGFTISVPASSANIGSGFDSLGLSLGLYLTLSVEKHSHWEIQHQSLLLPDFESYDKHFIYQIAKETAHHYGKQLPPCKVTIDSSIPLARGLGSSASAVIAGIELANQLCRLQLSLLDKLMLATEKEGHPDNVAASLVGGLVVTASTANDKINYYKWNSLNIDIITVIPDTELKTEASRSVLPEHFTRKYAASASSICNLFIVALTSHDYHLAGEMMENDLFHEPFRATLIPKYTEIKKAARSLGNYGTVISGAGPTMLVFAPKGKGQSIAGELQGQFSSYNICQVNIDTQGMKVTSGKEEVAEN